CLGHIRSGDLCGFADSQSSVPFAEPQTTEPEKDI
ncbi:hypothetical protein NPIL_301111, partial [Nephila pilipes]